MVLPCFFIAFAVKQSNSGDWRKGEGRGGVGQPGQCLTILYFAHNWREAFKMELCIHSPSVGDIVGYSEEVRRQQLGTRGQFGSNGVKMKEVFGTPTCILGQLRQTKFGEESYAHYLHLYIDKMIENEPSVPPKQ